MIHSCKGEHPTSQEIYTALKKEHNMNTTEQKFIPILFSTAMVQAILEGRKTMTRRIVKGTALQWLGVDGFTPEFVADPDNDMCPYGKVDDVLWVREKFGIIEGIIPAAYTHFAGKENYAWGLYGPPKWKPGIHMPKTACRIFLQVANIKVERLHDISEEDLIKEGVRYRVNSATNSLLWQAGENSAMEFMPANKLHADYKPTTYELLFAHWAELWCEINGAESWDANPWVWVIEFNKIDKPENFI